MTKNSQFRFSHSGFWGVQEYAVSDSRTVTLQPDSCHCKIMRFLIVCGTLYTAFFACFSSLVLWLPVNSVSTSQLSKASLSCPRHPVMISTFYIHVSNWYSCFFGLCVVGKSDGGNEKGGGGEEENTDEEEGVIKISWKYRQKQKEDK